MDTAADQIALAVERARLREEALEAEVLRRTDETRRALLASVSHDLRTPLASIKASAESLLQDEVAWTPAERRGFALAIREEADRLNRLVENLLDVSRIEAGALRPEREWYPARGPGGRRRGAAAATARHHLVVDVPETLPPVPLDYVLVGQALANLIENAVKYTPPGSTIRVTARQEGDAVVPRGGRRRARHPGSGPPRVFDKFYRVSGGDTAPHPGDRPGPGRGAGRGGGPRRDGRRNQPPARARRGGHAHPLPAPAPAGPPRPAGRRPAPPRRAPPNRWRARARPPLKTKSSRWGGPFDPALRCPGLRSETGAAPDPRSGARRPRR